MSKDPNNGKAQNEGKNIVVFSDGTGQDGGTGHNTNVYKTFNLILDRSKHQVSFYDPGLGTGFRKLTGNALGRGFSKNVRQCYEFIFENYRAGDKLFLFGFSRGAATVRSLTGFIDMFGILPRSRAGLIDDAWKIYKMSNRTKRKRAAEAFLGANHTMWAKVNFLGVWDTVAALGLPETRIDFLLDKIVPHGFHDFKLSNSVENAYHALAIDDVRKSFHPVLFDPRRATEEVKTDGGEIKEDEAEKRKLKQVWFAGMHSDVGGGYPKDQSGLSDIALEWMMGQAVKHGLRIFNNPNPNAKGLCKPDPYVKMHDARDTLWKKVVFTKRRRRWPTEYGKPVIHESVKLRAAQLSNVPGGGYHPWIVREFDEYDVEPWTHLEDWKNSSKEFKDADDESLEALAGWCEVSK